MGWLSDAWDKVVELGDIIEESKNEFREDVLGLPPKRGGSSVPYIPSGRGLPPWINQDPGPTFPFPGNDWLDVWEIIRERNRKKREEAQRQAREAANREREKEAQRKVAELARKQKTLKDEHNLSDERMKELLTEADTLSGELQGTIEGLRDKGMKPEQATLDYEKMLRDMKEQAGIRE